MNPPLTLFIDIDGTLITHPIDDSDQPRLLGHWLLGLMCELAARRAGWTMARAEEAIRAVQHRKVWWDWTDYLRRLELDAPAFWAQAEAASRGFLRPLEPRLREKLERLSHAGHRLCITSNNPSSGIGYKMRLAGLGRRWQREHVDRVLGTDAVEAMKWDARFWTRAMDLAEADPGDVVVIGDTWCDDVLMPYEAGVRRFVYLDPGDRVATIDPAGAAVRRASGWSEAVAWLTGGVLAESAAARLNDSA